MASELVCSCRCQQLGRLGPRGSYQAHTHTALPTHPPSHLGTFMLINQRQQVEAAGAVCVCVVSECRSVLLCMDSHVGMCWTCVFLYVPLGNTFSVSLLVGPGLKEVQQLCLYQAARFGVSKTLQRLGKPGTSLEMWCEVGKSLSKCRCSRWCKVICGRPAEQEGAGRPQP